MDDPGTPEPQAETPQPPSAEHPKAGEPSEGVEHPKAVEQPESAEQPKGADQSEGVEQPKVVDQPEGAEQPESVEQPKAAERPKAPLKPKEPAIWATGRRKEAVARVRLVPGGTGTILVNSQPYDQYFVRESLRLSIRQPLLVTHQLGKHNVLANIDGGGLTGQAGALRLGIARALTKFDPALRTSLRGAGLLTRDPREKERKKYGQKGARKRFQWTKR